LTGGLGQQRWKPLTRSGYALLATGAIVALAIVAVRWRDGGAALGWRPLSQSAVNAIQTCGGPMYNEYEDGGTLMWFVRGRGVFVDGRVEAYPLAFLRRIRSADLSGRYQPLFQEYGVSCAVTRTGSVLTRALRDDRRMTELFSDERWTVFGSDKPAGS
jgi:hypothetical protein